MEETFGGRRGKKLEFMQEGLRCKKLEISIATCLEGRGGDATAKNGYPLQRSSREQDVENQQAEKYNVFKHPTLSTTKHLITAMAFLN
ncbi:hypothetical protein BTVI_42824 [Pitangus sulphuratus]|nr:hypothetical protein BTVI_42824 [Pitangus sulphuratus]